MQLPKSSVQAELTSEQRLARLDALIASQSVSPVFQPIVNLQTGEVSGFEALTRPSRESGYAGPAELFADAEKFNRLWELEAVTRRKCLESAADFPEGVLLFFNSTPQVMADPRYTPDLLDAVKDVGSVPHGRIVLEVTEASDHQVVEGLAGEIRCLRSLGFQIAIDDVGAGTSGLNRMMLLRPHWLKIDRELIDRIDHDRFKHNLIRFLVHFARLSGVQVIAEGIERQEELATLIQLGVQFGQGFYLAKPSPAYQMLSPETRAFISNTIATTHPANSHPLGMASVGPLAQQAMTIQASTPVREVGADLLRNRATTGVVVVDGRRFVGWCSRDAILKSAATPDCAAPIGFITPSAASTVSPNASLAEVLELVSVRNDEEIAAPIVIAEQDRILGVLPLQRLLSAVVEHSASTHARVDPLSGLPGRVAGDKEIGRLAKSLPTEKRERIAIALIDIQRFNEYNAVFGYELGDQLILDLATLLKSVLKPTGPDQSLFHLGMDRFKVIGPQDWLESGIAEVMNRFDLSLGRGPSPTIAQPTNLDVQPDSSETTEYPQTPNSMVMLRALMITRAFQKIQEPRELFAMERQLRQRARSIAAKSAAHSILVRDEREPRTAARRLSA